MPEAPHRAGLPGTSQLHETSSTGDAILWGPVASCRCHECCQFRPPASWSDGRQAQQCDKCLRKVGAVAQSPEHAFLSQTMLDVLDRFSATELYGYREAQRAKFDFACRLVRDWERALVGQTLWSHDAGVDKDLRTLLADEQAAISVYVARDDVRHRRVLYEAIDDYRPTALGERVGRLRVFWVPSDFDADRSDHRALAVEQLQQQILSDLLFNVVFGRLSRHDVYAVAGSSGRIGILVALLGLIARAPALNYANMAAHLGVSSNTIRERFSLLLGLGLISTPPRALNPEASQKGKVLLDLLAAINDAMLIGRMSHELNAVLLRLECSPFAPPEPVRGATQPMMFSRLWNCCCAARDFGFAPERDRIYVPDTPLEVPTALDDRGELMLDLPEGLTLG